MKKKELLKEFKEAAGLASMKDADEVLTALCGVVKNHIKDEDGITLFPGVKFTAVYMNARTVKNPATGEPVEVSARYAPRVKFGKKFKDILN